MQQMYRTSRRHQPSKGDTLVGSPEQAHKIVADLDCKLQGKLSKQNRATYLAGRATLYEALGDPKMLEAAQEAYRFSKTANTAALVAVALHHFGRLKESMEWYERAWKYPHEPGFEIDIGYSGALLFQGKWQKAWPIVTNLKKRMVYAAYLPFWDGKPCKQVSVLSEGGFGDLLHNSRYLPMISNMGIDVTVYLPPFFFDHGFVDMAARQPWFPKMKLLTETPANVPAAGFFDLPALFNTNLQTIPNYPAPWQVDSSRLAKYNYLRTGNRPQIGFCWAARAMETPLCPDGVYRALTQEQAQSIVNKVDNVDWVSLQVPDDVKITHLHRPYIGSWEDTAAIIANLDLVVTVDTAVMHLAAIMGKPTWAILSGAVDWKFGLSGDCPWYPTIRTFRNEAFGFENAVRKVTEALQDFNVEFNNQVISSSSQCQIAS